MLRALQRITILYLPASFGWIVIATRLAMPYAFVAAVSTEVIASTSGLGHLVKGSSSIMNSAGMFSAMLALLFVSLAASYAGECSGREVTLEAVK